MHSEYLEQQRAFAPYSYMQGSTVLGGHFRVKRSLNPSQAEGNGLLSIGDVSRVL